MKVRGFDAIDKRSAAARALLAWRRGLLSDLGGEAAVSARELEVAELAVRTKLYVDSTGGWLMQQQPSLVLKRRRSVLPVLAEHIAALERRKRDATTPDPPAA